MRRARSLPLAGAAVRAVEQRVRDPLGVADMRFDVELQDTDVPGM